MRFIFVTTRTIRMIREKRAVYAMLYSFQGLGKMRVRLTVLILKWSAAETGDIVQFVDHTFYLAKCRLQFRPVSIS